VKNDIFKCIYVSGGGKEYDGGDWKIITDTKKSLYLKCIREPFFKGIDDLVLRVRKDNIGKHSLRIWGDGTFTIYPCRSGTPYYFEPR